MKRTMEATGSSVKSDSNSDSELLEAFCGGWSAEEPLKSITDAYGDVRVRGAKVKGASAVL